MRLPLLLMMMLPAIAAAGEKPLAIVVPPRLSGVVYKADELQRTLTAYLGERLRERGYEVLGSTTLTTADAACTAQACLEGIPARYNVDLVVAASLDSDDKAHNYRIHVQLFANSVGYKSRDRLCVGCSDYGARDLLGDTVVQMLGGTVVEAPAPSPAPAAAAPVPAAGPTHERSRWIYRGFAIGTGVVAVLALAQGFAEAAHDGDRGCDAKGCYHLDTTKGQAVFLTIGVAALVTTGVLAYFGWRPPPKQLALGGSGVGFHF